MLDGRGCMPGNGDRAICHRLRGDRFVVINRIAPPAMRAGRPGRIK
jgi:hypothetical protein